MRFIGCKENLLPLLDEVLRDNGVTAGSFGDLFSGTTSVARHYKARGFKVLTNDLLYFSYVLQRACIQVNAWPAFSRLLPTLSPHPDTLSPLERVLSHLEQLPGRKGFIYQHYTPGGTAAGLHRRAYFTDENGQKIDSVRECLEGWREEGLVDDDEYYVLLASLLETVPYYSNIAGTYGAFLKGWDPRALKPLRLRKPALLVTGDGRSHRAFNLDANRLVRHLHCDVLYLDPPYTTRQYLANYHLLETIARWDQPEIYGKSGLRPMRPEERSAYCQKGKATEAFADLVDNTRAGHILFSYNNEGLIPEELVVEVMSRRGEVRVYHQPYRRFRSDADSHRRRYKGDLVTEKVFYVRVER